MLNVHVLEGTDHINEFLSDKHWHLYVYITSKWDARPSRWGRAAASCAGMIVEHISGKPQTQRCRHERRASVEIKKQQKP